VSLQQPARIGRYQVVERLALGGMAELFKATMRGAHDFAKTVVVKKILPQFAEDAEFVRMFIDEAKLLSHLHHTKIVQVIELGESQHELFIAMEYVSGIDLLKLLRSYAQRRRVVSPEVGAHILYEVLDALDYAHNATDHDDRPLGIVHRDISPGNVLLSRGGIVKLTDFGIARFQDMHEKTKAGTLKGKFSYMSPEQVLHQPLDARSDLFAVGTLMAEVLTCRRLFVAPSELELLIMVREVNLSRLDKHGKDIEPGLRAILTARCSAILSSGSSPRPSSATRSATGCSTAGSG
jgi:serine/threonine-protein kinase